VENGCGKSARKCLIIEKPVGFVNNLLANCVVFRVAGLKHRGV